MSVGEIMLRACIKHGVSMDALAEICEIAARTDTRIAELEAERDHLRLLARTRFGYSPGALPAPLRS